jgi:hypothetical protein
MLVGDSLLYLVVFYSLSNKMQGRIDPSSMDVNENGVKNDCKLRTEKHTSKRVKE